MQNEIINEIRNMTKTLNNRIVKLEERGLTYTNGYKQMKSVIKMLPSLGSATESGLKITSKTKGLDDSQLITKRNALRGLINDTRTTLDGVQKEINAINSNFTNPVIEINVKNINKNDNSNKIVNKTRREIVMDMMYKFFNSAAYLKLVEEYEYDSDQLTALGEYLVDEGQMNVDDLIVKLEDLVDYVDFQEDDFDVDYFIYENLTNNFTEKQEEQLKYRETYTSNPEGARMNVPIEEQVAFGKLREEWKRLDF